MHETLNVNEIFIIPKLAKISKQNIGYILFTFFLLWVVVFKRYLQFYFKKTPQL